MTIKEKAMVKVKTTHRVSSFLMIIISLLFYTCKQTKPEEASSSKATIQSAYNDYFRIGAALSVFALNDSLSLETTKRHFNSITPENCMKWERIHPSPGVYDFESSDRFVEFGEANKMEIVGHVLVWHSQTPEWVFQDEAGNPLSREALLERMEQHINTVVGRYKGKIKYWDVVNEALENDGSLRKSPWLEIIGEDYVQKAFEFARKADPDAVLIYNDYSLPSPEKRDGVVELVGKLKEKGVRVDAIGMQAHYHLDYPEIEELEASILAFSGLGCKVHISEMDINMLPWPANDIEADVSMNFEYKNYLNPWPEQLPDSMQTVLADRYVQFFQVFNRNKDKIDRVTFWGIQDGGSWLNSWPIPGRTNYPLLIDRAYEPKKAYYSVMELVED